MNNFKDFGIKLESPTFTGDKIKMSKVLNKEIEVLAYRIENSKYDGQRLDMQIQMNGVKYLLWTGSKRLIEAIKLVPSDGLPFITTIIQEDERYEFT